MRRLHSLWDHSQHQIRRVVMITALLMGFAGGAPAAQDPPGSTMTLEQLRIGPKRSEEPLKPLIVRPAAEPVPALAYRLYPAHWELQPGSAQLHFCRALVLFSQIPKENQIEWQEWSSAEASPTEEQMTTAVAALKNVLDELHHLAMSEDITWDHRIRDLRGTEIYSFLLPDVQEARSMGRILRLKIRHQLRQKDFDGAISSMRDGFRLAQFVGQGETLIQKLVGIAIAAIMRDGLEEAIGTPGCPNLYWAISTIPRPLIDVHESGLWELSNIHRVFPALLEAETEIWTDAVAAEKWAQLVDDISDLTDGNAGTSQGTRLTLAIAGVALVDAARERLLAGGIPEQRIENLPSLQIILMDASIELRKAVQELSKGMLLPSDVAIPIMRREDEEFKAWIASSKTTSVGAVIASVLFPAVVNVLQTETRMHLGHNRLMTLEALRMYAAEHDGRLPSSLNELRSAPAMKDPFSDGAFEYRVESVDGRQMIILKAAGPTNYRPLQELNAIFDR